MYSKYQLNLVHLTTKDTSCSIELDKREDDDDDDEVNFAAFTLRSRAAPLNQLSD